MEKQALNPIELLQIANYHAYCAEHLLQTNAELMMHEQEVDALLPISSLMLLAFELTLKAYLLEQNPHVKQYKQLTELIALNEQLGLSKEDIELLKTLAKQQNFRKGIDPLLWNNRQEQHGFCVQIMNVYSRLLALMPLELQSDYQT